MRNGIAFTAAVVFTWFAGPGLAGSAGAATPSTPIAAILRELDGLDHPGCAIGVAQGGEIADAGARGAADMESHTPLTPDTIFNIGSISKQFTAFGVMLLAQQGKLSLDDSIRRHVPELGTYANAVTLRHLLHHVGGLREYATLLRLEGHPYSEAVTREQALRILSRQHAANAPPNTAYEYSNTGYFLLGVVVERLSGRSLARFSQERIFDPLGMRDTSVVDHYPVANPRFARGYQKSGAGFVEDPTIWEQVGDGQVHSTVVDMIKWADNLVTGRVGGKALIVRMREPYRIAPDRLIPYGAGVALGTYRGLQALRHGGDWAGFHSHLMVFPQQRFAVTSLCNWLESDPERYSHRIVDRYLAGTAGEAETAAEVVALRGMKRRGEVRQLPAGLYRNPVRASYVRLVHPEGRAALEFGTDSYRLRPIEPHLYEVGEPHDQTYAVFMTPTSEDHASIVIQDSPEPIRYEAVKPWRAETTRFEGTFESVEANAQFVLSSAGGTLTLGWNGGSYPLEPMGTWEFAGQGVPDDGQTFTLQFTADAGELRYFTDGLRGLRFERGQRGALGSTKTGSGS